MCGIVGHAGGGCAPDAVTADLDRLYRTDRDVPAAEKGGHDCFMSEEIVEQPQAVADPLPGRDRPRDLARPVTAE